MSVSLKGLNKTFIEQHSLRLETIEGAIRILEDMVCIDIIRVEKNRMDGDEEELKDYIVLNDDNFNILYDHVLDDIFSEEREKGFSQYRVLLNRVDRHIDHLTIPTRKEARAEEERKDFEAVYAHEPFYVKDVFHCPLFIADTMRVG